MSNELNIEPNDKDIELEKLCTDSVELILNTTGPFLTTRIYDNSKYQERITLIPAELIAPITHSDIRKIMKEETSMTIESKVEKSFAIHYFFGSWHE